MLNLILHSEGTSSCINGSTENFNTYFCCWQFSFTMWNWTYNNNL